MLSIVPNCLICFAHNSQKEKKNLQDSAGVYVYNVGDREQLDRPTAKLIKDFSLIEGNTHYMDCSLVTHGQSLRDMHAQLFQQNVVHGYYFCLKLFIVQ